MKISELKLEYPMDKVPGDAQELVDMLWSTDNRKIGRAAKKLMDAQWDGKVEERWTDGLILAVKNALQEINRAGVVEQSTAEERRAHRILTITDSTGRSRARKF